MKIGKREIEFKLPTQSEIARARDKVYSNENIRLKEIGVMASWEGAGWHKDEIYFGILVGLQIAESRRRKAVADGSTPDNAG